MHIDNKIRFSREISLDRTRLSAILLGPRLTGKTYLLLQLDHAAYFNLLDPEAELRYRAQPRLFWEEVRSLLIPLRIFAAYSASSESL